MKGVDEVKEILKKASTPELPVVLRSPWDAYGFVLAEDVFASLSVPHYNAAAMDGIAVDAHDSFAATEKNPLRIPKDRYRLLNTGDPVHHPFNSVIPVEEITANENNEEEGFTLYRSTYPWNHVRIVGEDIVKGQLIAPKNSIVDERMIPTLIAAGAWKVAVKRKPHALIIPTGDEIVRAPVQSLKEGEIIDFNSWMIYHLLQRWGCECDLHDPVKDDTRAIENALRKGTQNNELVILIAGSSAGGKDYSVKALESTGEVLVHGVKMMPGKPFLFGMVNGKTVFGIPGFAASAYYAMLVFVKLFVERLLAVHFTERVIRCELSQDIPSKPGYDEYIRVVVATIDRIIKAVPLKRGASLLKSLYEASGYFVIPAEAEGISRGKSVSVVLTDERFREDRNILLVGSNDLSIDILKSMAKDISDYTIVSLNRGSMGGLVALRNRETHLAPTHLLEPETGQYNVSFVKKIIPEARVSLIHIAKRSQGLIVQKRNPLGIEMVTDLKRVRFVNRQKGSGTRILLDFLLQKEGIDPHEIEGYFLELYTHMAVCGFIAGGYADCGMGIKSAADSFGLDFIPLIEEEYELAAYQDFFEDTRSMVLLDIIRAKDFRSRLEGLGGYNTEKTGQIRGVS